MPKYVLAYHGRPDINSPEDGQKLMKDWRAWMQGMGDAVIEPGLPVGPSKTIYADRVADDGGANPLSGFTVIEAPDMDTAIAMAKPCPHVTGGGSIEIAEAMDMEM